MPSIISECIELPKNPEQRMRYEHDFGIAFNNAGVNRFIKEVLLARTKTTAEFLSEHHCGINDYAAKNNTPLTAAINLRNTKVIQQLLNLGALPYHPLLPRNSQPFYLLGLLTKDKQMMDVRNQAADILLEILSDATEHTLPLTMVDDVLQTEQIPYDVLKRCSDLVRWNKHKPSRLCLNFTKQHLGVGISRSPQFFGLEKEPSEDSIEKMYEEMMRCSLMS